MNVPVWLTTSRQTDPASPWTRVSVVSSRCLTPTSSHRRPRDSLEIFNGVNVGVRVRKPEFTAPDVPAPLETDSSCIKGPCDRSRAPDGIAPRSCLIPGMLATQRRKDVRRTTTARVT